MNLNKQNKIEKFFSDFLYAVDSMNNDRNISPLAVWSDFTNDELHNPKSIFENFRLNMEAERDLSCNHVGAILNQLNKENEIVNSSFDILQYSRRFINLLRPWYFLWFDFIKYVIKWSMDRNIYNIIFLARDALPFYYIAKGIVKDGVLPHLYVVQIDRMTMSYASLLSSLECFTSSNDDKITIVDSGCYGTIVNTLINNICSFHKSISPAVFFLYSRNPHIFGYLNYVITSDYTFLKESNFNIFNANDLGAIAMDTLEAIPKPYIVKTQPELSLKLSDALSFIISCMFYKDLFKYSRFYMRYFKCHSLNNMYSSTLYILSDAYQKFIKGIDDSQNIFWIPPTKKWLDGDKWLSEWNLGTIPPQNEIFGTISG